MRPDEMKEDMLVAVWVAKNRDAIRVRSVEVVRMVTETLAPDGSVLECKASATGQIRVTFDTPYGPFTEQMVGIHNPIRERILAEHRRSLLNEDEDDGG